MYTSLNADMPLIRYRVGDSGRLGEGDTACSCGRTLPIMGTLEGRNDKTFSTRLTAGGFADLDPIFKSQLPAREAQVIQEALDRVRVRYVPTANFSLAAGRSIVARLQERLGDVQVILQPVEEVPRGANGKFRAVICDLTPEQKRTVGAAQTISERERAVS